MFCEAYNKSLTDAAASGEALSRVLQQHVVSCDSCRAAFAKEQSLLAAIDAGLRASANSEFPATLIPRVHVALNNESLPQRGFQKWIFVGAIVSCALVVAVTLQLKHREVPTPNKIAGTQTPSATSPRLIESNPSARPVLHPVPQLSNNAEPPRSIAAGTPPSLAAEVLVPDEERAAFAKFLRREQLPAAKSSAVVFSVPEAPKDLTPLPPVEIASLTVLPLNGEEGSHDEF